LPAVLLVCVFAFVGCASFNSQNNSNVTNDSAPSPDTSIVPRPNPPAPPSTGGDPSPTPAPTPERELFNTSTPILLDALNNSGLEILNPKKDYPKFFAFSFEMPDWVVVDYSNEEYEALFKKILRGEEEVGNHLFWFAMNPQFIFRHNKANLRLVQTVMELGEFPQQLREEYAGLIVWASPCRTLNPWIGAAHIPRNGISYQIFFRDDWSVHYIRNSRMLGVIEFTQMGVGGFLLNPIQIVHEGELRQVDHRFFPIRNEAGELLGYRLSSTSVHINVYMGGGVNVSAGISIIYNTEVVTSVWWQGDRHVDVRRLSHLRLTFDSSNMYSQGQGGMFPEINILTEQSGLWNYENIWTIFREISMTPREVIPTFAQPKFLFI